MRPITNRRTPGCHRLRTWPPANPLQLRLCLLCLAPFRQWQRAKAASVPVPECLRARVRMTTCGRALPEKNVLGGSIDPGGVSRCLFQARGWLGTPSPRCSPLRFDSGGAVSGGQAKCRNVADGVPTFERAPHFLDGTPIVRSTTSMAWGYWWASVPWAPRVRGHLKYGCPGPCFDSFGEALCFGTSAFGQRGSLQGASPGGACG